MYDMLSQEIADNLLKLNDRGHLYHRESQTLEYKETFSFSNLKDCLRYFAAFANNKGGYLIFGVRDKPKPNKLVGLTEKSKDAFENFDEEVLTTALKNHLSADVDYESGMFMVREKYIVIFYIKEAASKPIIIKYNSGKIKNGDILYRYNSQVSTIEYAELNKIIEDKIEKNNNSWKDLVSKIAVAGAENSAILNLNDGVIEKDNKTLIIDEALVEKIKWIKEGEFSEKKGATALKLIGDVKSVDVVNVTTEKDKLKLYPLSATKLAEKIEEKESTINRNKIWAIISEKEMKGNELYSSFVFRNKEQEDKFEKGEITAKGIPVVYNDNAVKYIIDEFKGSSQ